MCPEGRSGGIVALNDGNSLTITNCVTLSSYIKAGSGDAGGANAILGADNPAEDSNAVSTISNSYSWSGLKLYENNVEIARSNNANDSYDGGYLDLDELKTAQFWLGDVNFDAGISNSSTRSWYGFCIKSFTRQTSLRERRYVDIIL